MAKNTTHKEVDRIVRKPELFSIIGMSDTSVWRMEQAGTFPKRLRLGGSACGWMLSIAAWLAERAAARYQGTSPLKGDSGHVSAE